MLSEIVPAKEITGGPWYTDQEFDSEFIDELCRYIIQYVSEQGIIGLVNIHDKMRISGISKVSF